MSAASTPTPLQALAAFSAGVTFDALPGPVVESFTHRVLDTVGICIAATALDTSGMATRVASAWGGPGEATVVGHHHGVPGPDESAAAWLCDRKIRLTGAETIAYECIYPERGHALLPVHRMLLVEHGIHIIEVLNLTELVKDSIHEFLFVVTPLKVVGATGVPVRPVAVAG